MTHGENFSMGGRIVNSMLIVAALLSGSARADQKPHLASLDDFAKCTDRWEADACLDALQVFVKAHPAQAFDAGKVVTMGGSRYVSVVARKSYGSSYNYEVYPEGDKGPFYVAYSDQETKSASAKSIRSEFAK